MTDQLKQVCSCPVVCVMHCVIVYHFTLHQLRNKVSNKDERYIVAALLVLLRGEDARTHTTHIFFITGQGEMKLEGSSSIV